ncbi:MAG: transglutaminase-like domain-containing protein [Microthrixaceae bacterium]
MSDELPPEPNPADTAPTWFVDSDSDGVAAFVDRTLAGTGRAERPLESDDPTAVAVALFTEVRDSIRYDPYRISEDPADFRASAIAGSEANWCVPKAVLYTAALRSVDIPARLAFADVRNHLTSEKLSQHMGTDLFVWHGYTEVYLRDRWLKVSTAFNIEMCRRFGVKVLDFDGSGDALMHPYDTAGKQHMEYVAQRGTYSDLPLEEMFATFAELYPNTWSDRPSDPTF